MKKYKICLLLLLAVCFVFAGCSGDKYLKTASTTDSLSSFFGNNYTMSINEFKNVNNDSTIISAETEKVTYSNYMLPIMSVLPEERCMISVVDYLCAIDQATSRSRIDTVTKTKLYEYDTVFAQELQSLSNAQSLTSLADDVNAVVLIKSANNDTKINAWLYYKKNTDVYSIATLLEEQNSANLTCEFSVDNFVVQTNTYTLNYGKNGGKVGNVATIAFNESKGCVNYEIKTTLTYNNVATNFTFEKSIYEYLNSAVGVRTLSKFNNKDKATTIIYEQITKDFYKKLKVGEVKDEDNILSMETMIEDNLAKPNSSDSKGFNFESREVEDGEGNPILYIPYGGAE